MDNQVRFIGLIIRYDVYRNNDRNQGICETGTGLAESDDGLNWIAHDKPVNFYYRGKRLTTVNDARLTVLENKQTGKGYTHINTHLDHIGDYARVKQAKILCSKVRELLGGCDTLVCTGDFNTGESSIVYEEMLTTLRDSKYSAEKSDEGTTFHDYGRVKGVTEPIDYVFITDNVKVKRYRIIRNTPWNMYPSDHYGISVDFNM